FETFFLYDVIDHFGANETRRDAVGEDIFLCTIACNRSVKCQHPRFRCAIVQVLDAVSAMTRSAGDVDQYAASLAAESLDCSTTKLGSGEEIHTQCPIPLGQPLVEFVGQGVLLIDTGIVDENVYAAAPSPSLIPKSFRFERRE